MEKMQYLGTSAGNGTILYPHPATSRLPDRRRVLNVLASSVMLPTFVIASSRDLCWEGVGTY